MKNDRQKQIQMLATFPSHISLQHAAMIVESIAINPTSGCWEWIKSLHLGYGRCSAKGLSRIAHRAVYFLFYPDTDKSLTLDHVCRNRCCVNPNHLDPVSGATNTRRMWVNRLSLRSSDDRTSTHCIRGHEFAVLGVKIRKNGTKRCAECERAYNKTRYQKDPDRIKKWSRANKDRHLKKIQEWINQHPDRVKEYRKRARQRRLGETS